MIIAALLSTVTALPAANSTGDSEISAVSPEVQALAAKAIASVKLVKGGEATPEEAVVSVGESLKDLGTFLSSTERADGSSFPSLAHVAELAKGFGAEVQKATGINGQKGFGDNGFGGHGHGGHGHGGHGHEKFECPLPDLVDIDLIDTVLYLVCILGNDII